MAWGTDLGTPRLTPTADALQVLWINLQAISSLTLRARLRDEPHKLDDIPSELAAQTTNVVAEIEESLAGSALEPQWEAWRAKAVESVLTEAEQDDLDPRDVWVARVASHRDSRPLADYLLLWVMAIEFDMRCGPDDHVNERGEMAKI